MKTVFSIARLLIACAVFLLSTLCVSALEEGDMPRWHVFVQFGGPAFLPGEMESTLDPVHDAEYSKTRVGLATGLGAAYFLTDHFGLGLRFGTSMITNSTHSTIYYEGSLLSGPVEDNVDHLYVGPYASYRLYSRDKKNIVYFDGGLGLLDYGRWHIMGNKVKLMDARGYSLGGDIGVGYDRMISNHFAVGFSVAVVAGYCDSLTIISEEPFRRVSIDDERSRWLLSVPSFIGVRLFF